MLTMACRERFHYVYAAARDLDSFVYLVRIELLRNGILLCILFREWYFCTVAVAGKWLLDALFVGWQSRSECKVKKEISKLI